ncbi:endoplasmic reticulum membrane-associated RNA degradation protein [Acrasis kona]|uniref:Endoplasmic reticulum membrane-associated RNA degradation protein n=1 Tax=Acrasis kona TaxID=1008807 RepID=A0AAW2YZ34_9EUKA
MKDVFLIAQKIDQAREDGRDISQYETLMGQSLQQEMNTYLSPLVRKLVIIDASDEQLTKPLQGNDEHFFDEFGFLNWSMFTKQIMTGTQVIDDIPEVSYKLDIHLFPSASVYLKRFILHHLVPFVKKQFVDPEPKDVTMAYGSCGLIFPRLLQSPNIPEFEDASVENGIFMELVSLYRRGLYQICFSVGISYFEKSLWSMLSGRFNMKSTRPVKINEILIMSELKEILGQDIIFFLRLIIGPIQGMNIRNLLWHGFFSDDEFHQGYTSLLLMLVASISKIKIVQESIKNFTNRPLQSGARFDVPICVPNYNADSLVSDSYFVPASQRRLWKQGLDLYQNGFFFYSSVLLFPLLELKHKKALCILQLKITSAETECCYITFEDVLSPQLEYASGRNLLFDNLDPNILFALLDVVAWSDGPRIRDKLSHGIMDPQCIPKSVVDRLVVTCLMLLSRYTNKTHCDKLSYQPIYHPQVILMSSVTQTRATLELFYENFVKELVYSRSDDTENAIAPKQTKVQIMDLLSRADNHIKNLSNKHSLFDDHLQDFVVTDRLDMSDIPVQVPLQYADKLGNNISTIQILRKICSGVVVIIDKVRESIEKQKLRVVEEQKKGRSKNAILLEKFTSNIHSLFLLLVLMMRSVEISFLHVNEPYYELCQSCKLVTDSLPVCIERNNWPKPKTIQKFLCVLLNTIK